MVSGRFIPQSGMATSLFSVLKKNSALLFESSDFFTVSQSATVSSFAILEFNVIFTPKEFQSAVIFKSISAVLLSKTDARREALRTPFLSRICFL